MSKHLTLLAQRSVMLCIDCWNKHVHRIIDLFLSLIFSKTLRISKCVSISHLCFVLSHLNYFVISRRLVLNQSINMMLCTTIRSCYFKHVCYAQQCFLCLFIRYNLYSIQNIYIIHLSKFRFLQIIIYLQYCEIFEHTVHHVSFWQMFQFLYKINHIFAHGGSLYTVNESRTFQARILSFNFFNHLFAERAHFCWACYHNILIAFISSQLNNK